MPWPILGLIERLTGGSGIQIEERLCKCYLIEPRLFYSRDDQAVVSAMILSTAECLFTSLSFTTSDEKPSPRRWRDSPLPLERGQG